MNTTHKSVKIANGSLSSSTKKLIHTAIFAVLATSLITPCIKNSSAQAATKSISIVNSDEKVITVSGYRTIRSATVKVSNSNVKAKLHRTLGTMSIKAKKAGSSTVKVRYTLKTGNKKTLTLKVMVKSLKSVCKQAFRIQNSMRAEKNIPALTWSDDAYEFAKYRIKASGFDYHKNINRDAKNFFGTFFYSDIKGVIGENMISTSDLITATKAMHIWKNSAGHYRNLMTEEHLCGAIACTKDVWCAVFFNMPESQLRTWRKANETLIPVTVKFYDIESDSYIDGYLGYYEADNRLETLTTVRTRDASGKTVYLTRGKTYTFYSNNSSENEGAVKQITVTADEELEKNPIIILSK